MNRAQRRDHGETGAQDISYQCRNLAKNVHACYTGVHLKSTASTFIIPTLSESELIVKAVKASQSRPRNYSTATNPSTAGHRHAASTPDFSKHLTLPLSSMSPLQPIVDKVGIEFDQARCQLARDLIRNPESFHKPKVCVLPNLKVAVVMILLGDERKDEFFYVMSPAQSSTPTSETSEISEILGSSPKSQAGSPGLRTRSLSSSKVEQTTSNSFTDLQPPTAHHSIFAHGPQFYELLEGVSKSELSIQSDVKGVWSLSSSLNKEDVVACTVRRSRRSSDIVHVPTRLADAHSILEVVIPLKSQEYFGSIDGETDVAGCTFLHATSTSPLFQDRISSTLQTLPKTVASFRASSEYASIAAGSDLTARSLINDYGGNVAIEDVSSAKKTLSGSMTKRTRSISSVHTFCSQPSPFTNLLPTPEETEKPNAIEHEDDVEGKDECNPAQQFIIRAFPKAKTRDRSTSHSGHMLSVPAKLAHEVGFVESLKGSPQKAGYLESVALPSMKSQSMSAISFSHSRPLEVPFKKGSDIISNISIEDLHSEKDESPFNNVAQESEKLSTDAEKDLVSLDRKLTGEGLSENEIIVRGGPIDTSLGEDAINWGSFLPLGLTSRLGKCFSIDSLENYQKDNLVDALQRDDASIPIREFAKAVISSNKLLVFSKVKDALEGDEDLMTAYDDDYSLVIFNLHHIYESPDQCEKKASRDSLEFACYSVALAFLKRFLTYKRKGPIYLIPATQTNIFMDQTTLSLETDKDIVTYFLPSIAPEAAGDQTVDNDEVSSADENENESDRPPSIPALKKESRLDVNYGAIGLEQLNDSPSAASDHATQSEIMLRRRKSTERRGMNQVPAESNSVGTMTRRGIANCMNEDRFQPNDKSQYIGFKFYTDLFNLAQIGYPYPDRCSVEGEVKESGETSLMREKEEVNNIRSSRETIKRTSSIGTKEGFRLHSRNNSCTSVPDLIRTSSTASIEMRMASSIKLPILGEHSSFGWPKLSSDNDILLLEDFRKRDFDVLNYTEDQLLVILSHLFESIWREVDRICLRKFLLAVRRNYRRNPFHNLHHGVNVVHFVFMVLDSMPEFADVLGSPKTAQEPNETFMEYRGSPLDLIALFVAGLCHDIDHPGNNNVYEINSSSPLALLHNDSAVLEHHHASITMALLRDPELNIFSSVPTSQLRVLRSTIISCILATDMSLHFESCNKLATTPVYHELKLNDPHRPARAFFFDTLVHTADICAQLYPFGIAEEWEARISEEFMVQTIVEGVQDLPVAPYMMKLHDPPQRYRGQVAFLSSILTPWWNELIKIFKGNSAIDFYYGNLKANLSRYNLLASRASTFEEVMDALADGALDAARSLRSEFDSYLKSSTKRSVTL